MSFTEEVMRKSIHAGSVVIPLAVLFVPKMEMVLVLTLLSAGMLIVDVVRLRNRPFRKFFLGLFGKVLRDKEQEGGMTASTILVTSSALTILVFRTEIAVAALVFLAVGDSLAALVGKRYGETLIVSGRTLEGSLAALLGCLIVSMPLLQLSAVKGWHLNPAGLAAGALAATIAELFDVPLDDNLRIPMFAGLVMELVIPG